MDNSFTPKTYPHRIIVMEKINGLPIRKEAKNERAQFVQDADK